MKTQEPACTGYGGTLVPRTRSSHDFSAGTFANFGFKSGTRIIDLLVSFSIPKFAQRSLRMLANFGIGTLAAVAIATPALAQQFGPPELIEAAKKEGRLVYYTANFAEVEQEVINAFNKRFPEIKVEMVRAPG